MLARDRGREINSAQPAWDEREHLPYLRILADGFADVTGRRLQELTGPPNAELVLDVV